MYIYIKALFVSKIMCPDSFFASYTRVIEDKVDLYDCIGFFDRSKNSKNQLFYMQLSFFESWKNQLQIGQFRNVDSTWVYFCYLIFSL